MFRNLVGLFCAVAVSSCGGIIPSQSTCSISLTGAQTLTDACSIRIVSDPEKTAFSIVGTKSPLFTGGVTFSGDINAGDYSDGIFAGFVTTLGIVTWNENLHHTDQQDKPDKGTFLLHFSSIGDAVSAGSATGHSHAKGTLSVTMPADPTTGASGTVVATVTFSDTLGIYDPTGSGTGGGSGSGGGSGQGGGAAAGGGSATGGGSSAGGGSATGGGSGNGGTGGGTGCTAVISGGTSATLPCTVSAAKVNDVTAYTVEQIDSSSATKLVCAVNLSGTYGTSALGPAAPVKSESCSVSVNNTQAWQSFFGSGTDSGTFSLTFSNIGTFPAQISEGTGEHGTWTATIPPNTGTGATGDVSVSITF